MCYCKGCGAELKHDYCADCLLKSMQSAPKFWRVKHLPQHHTGSNPFGNHTVAHDLGAPTAAAASGELYYDTKHSSLTLVYKTYDGVGSAYSAAGSPTAIDSCDTFKVVQAFTPSAHGMSDNYLTIQKQIANGRLIPTALISGLP